MTEFKVLCVTDDAILKEQLCSLLASFGYDVWGATRAKHAVALLSGEDFDLVVLGPGFTKKERRELAVRTRDTYQTPVLLVGDESDPEIPADGLVYAHYDTAALVSAVERLLRRKALAIAS
jgi:DNA-binding response OmpR family regulator